MSCQYLATGEYTCDNQPTQEEVKNSLFSMNNEVKPEKFTNSGTSCNQTEYFTNNTQQHIIYHSNGDIHAE